jgi:hypothetical protein
MGASPVAADAGFHLQRHGERCGVLHHGPGDGGGGFGFVLLRFEEQFVVHLQEHAGLQAARKAAGSLIMARLITSAARALQRGVDGLRVRVAPGRRPRCRR